MKTLFQFETLVIVMAFATLAACSSPKSTEPATNASTSTGDGNLPGPSPTPNPMPGPSPTPGPVTGLPAGLPTFFAIGLANNDTTWMKNSGTQFNYRYQYLAGGVNTGNGWANWNPNGEFATYYMNESAAADLIPVLTYYQLTQSNPSPVDGAPETNLRTAATMNAYFSDFKLLMQKAGAFNKAVVIHHEPDLWAYIESKSANPSGYQISVASSGFAEAAGYENSAKGFAQVLVALKAKYAPKAVLAWHASFFATGTDLILNKADPNAVGTQIGNYFNSLQANFDMIFYDASDRDAGYYQYVYGDGGAHWWKDADFVTFRTYIAKISQITGRKGMIWQIPIGNTLYAACNNTNNHYQDNRAQYFLQAGNRQHIVEYANAGIVALLFGRGAGGPTTYDDANGDGVTNPAPINGNTLTSTVSDDDGGFIRFSSKAYYTSGPVPLP